MPATTSYDMEDDTPEQCQAQEPGPGSAPRLALPRSPPQDLFKKYVCCVHVSMVFFFLCPWEVPWVCEKRAVAYVCCSVRLFPLFLYVYIGAQFTTCGHVCVYKYIYIYMYVCIYIYIYAYINTHMYIISYTYLYA